MPRPAYPSLAQQPTNVTARNRFATQLLLRVDFHLKAHLLPELRKHIRVTRGLVSEVEVVAFMHFERVQLPFQDAFGKLSRRHQREVTRKRQHQHCIDPRSLEQAELFRHWSQ